MVPGSRLLTPGTARSDFLFRFPQFRHYRVEILEIDVDQLYRLPHGEVDEPFAVLVRQLLR